MKESAIFLDRDGTINRRPLPHQHVTSSEEFCFLEGALDALAFLAQNSERKILLVTNQSGVPQEQVDDLHDWMTLVIESIGGRVDEIYVCPHAPEDECDCRKPKPGLLLQAAQDLDLDLSKSVMVGDSASDLEAGWAAGVQDCYLVLADALGRLPHGNYRGYATLLDVARAIVSAERD